ncbi:Methyl-directed repair DNA adenine methylase [hydrothermal vent metagenome]|uniref:site-specific DNA-methyltransferase (adenine-specific) n=1 Tax=hydrothermal vent metagenome TaxID=652676 RepID=A0A3B1ACS1_9ZZZZ
MKKNTIKDPDALIKHRPFLKWAGNKYHVLSHIEEILPHGKRLIEPFAGSAAVFLNTNYSRYIIADNNSDLINLYNFLKEDGADFIKKCRRMFTARNNNEALYYKYREEFNRSKNIERKAILFLYFNRHGYNGLCRYNLKGGFNVPFGRYTNPYFPEKEMLFFHKKSQKALFKHADFSNIMNKARSGDVIYCDPPYVPLSKSANFTSYSTNGFKNTQQIQLAEIAKQLSNKGISVLISNHNTSFTQQSYSSALAIKQFNVRRFISCKGSQRNKVAELLALF